MNGKCVDTCKFYGLLSTMKCVTKEFFAASNDLVLTDPSSNVVDYNCDTQGNFPY